MMRAWILALALAVAAPTVADAQERPRSSQSDKKRAIGGAASALMALAGLIMVVRRYRQRSRLPSEDRKFGDYRGPKER